MRPLGHLPSASRRRSGTGSTCATDGNTAGSAVDVFFANGSAGAVSKRLSSFVQSSVAALTGSRPPRPR